MSPAQFTAMAAEAFRNKRPGLQVEIVKDLELKLVRPDREGLISLLTNTYDVYQQDAEAGLAYFEKCLAVGLEIYDGGSEPMDRCRIIPVIKHRPWLEDTRQTAIQRGSKELSEQVYDDFGPDLIVVYAEDSERSTRYMNQKEFEKTKIDRKDLRALACENLRRLLPLMEYRGADGFYRIVADGTYESSLLLLDHIWTSRGLDVKGQIVVAIPTRDLLIVTGTGNPAGLEEMKSVVKRASAEGAYRLTSKLFVYRNGKFDEFKEDIEEE